MSGDAGAFPKCEVNPLITPGRTTIQVRSSGYRRVEIGRSCWKGHSTGRHEKAPFRLASNLLAALNGAPWTRC